MITGIKRGDVALSDKCVEDALAKILDANGPN